VSSSRSTTKAEGNQTSVQSNKPSTGEAINRQEDLNEDCGDITEQDQPVQAADEQENQEEEDIVPMNEDVNIVENSVDGEPSYQVRSKRDHTAMKSDITAGRLATSRPHEFQGRIC